MSDAEIVREALYAAARGPDVSLAPVPGTPVGDAHLALDRLAEDRNQLAAENCELLARGLAVNEVRRQLAEAARDTLDYESRPRAAALSTLRAALAASDALDKEEA